MVGNFGGIMCDPSIFVFVEDSQHHVETGGKSTAGLTGL